MSMDLAVGLPFPSNCPTSFPTLDRGGLAEQVWCCR